MDNRTGSVGQAKGIKQALNCERFEIVDKKIEYNKLSGLPNSLLGRSLLGITSASKKELKAPFPDLVVSISRRTVPIARYLRKASHGKTKIMQLTHPGTSGLTEFDLIVLPEHDRHKKTTPNIFYVTGCPHRVTPQALAEVKDKWAEVFAGLPRPWTAVIIGGAIKNKPFTLENARMLGEAIKNLKAQIGGSILITTSRRTGAAAETEIKKAIAGIPAYTYWWGEQKENPIMGFWALADNIVATGDSVSMPCECCGSGKPVLLFTGQNWLTKKHERFVQSLIAGGYAVHIDSPNAVDFKPQKGLNPSAEIAGRIIKLLS